MTGFLWLLHVLCLRLTTRSNSVVKLTGLVHSRIHVSLGQISMRCQECLTSVNTKDISIIRSTTRSSTLTLEQVTVVGNGHGQSMIEYPLGDGDDRLTCISKCALKSSITTPN